MNVIEFRMLCGRSAVRLLLEGIIPGMNVYEGRRHQS